MTIRKNILTIIILFLISCNGKKEKQGTVSESEPIIESTSEMKTESELNKDYSKSAELFVKEVLRENIRVHSFDLSKSDHPKCLNLFLNNELEKIIAYSNKNYPKTSEPDYYEHFILFVAIYKNEGAAQNTYNKIRKESFYRFSDLKGMDEVMAKRVKALTIGAKPGGMITRVGKEIYSLVETCRETPIGGNWLDYENKFLEYVTDVDEEIQVLNADCGMDKYYIEKRKASR